MLKTAFKIGIKPSELDAMPLWAFQACIEAWNEANGGREAMSDERFNRAAELYDAAPDRIV